MKPLLLLRSLFAIVDRRARGRLAWVLLLLKREHDALEARAEQLAGELLRLDGRNRDLESERNRLQDFNNWLLCRGFQFEARGAYDPPRQMGQADLKFLIGERARELAAYEQPRPREQRHWRTTYDASSRAMHDGDRYLDELRRHITHAAADYILLAVLESAKDPRAERLRATIEEKKARKW